MSDMRVSVMILPDDGRDGLFWRDGVLFIRSSGIETNLKETTEPGVYEDIMKKATHAHNDARRASLVWEATKE